MTTKADLELVLKALHFGVAHLDSGEFCFRGIRYSVTDIDGKTDWSIAANALRRMGWKQ